MVRRGWPSGRRRLGSGPCDQAGLVGRQRLVGRYRRAGRHGAGIQVREAADRPRDQICNSDNAIWWPEGVGANLQTNVPAEPAAPFSGKTHRILFRHDQRGFGLFHAVRGRIRRDGNLEHRRHDLGGPGLRAGEWRHVADGIGIEGEWLGSRSTACATGWTRGKRGLGRQRLLDAAGRAGRPRSADLQLSAAVKRRVQPAISSRTTSGHRPPT
jgi:hypothetical protein